MCGIAGIIKKRAELVEEADLGRMLGVQAHRGPDGSGVALTDEGRVGFGHVRLSIIDLTTGDQPLWSRDGQLLITFNGEIYDHLEHRRALEKDGLVFRTRSDTEVIVNLYRRYGLHFLSHLNGEFSFAIWDRAERRFLAARDRYGVKPFFYRETTDELLFASEAKGLLALPRVPRAFSGEHVMTALLSAPMPAVSPFAGTEVLRPGHYLMWEVGQTKSKTVEYWRPRYEPQPSLSPGEAIERTRHHFSRAVERRMVADVPVCSFLSGGLDSTLVTAEMARQSGARTVTAFTIGFSHSEYDETETAANIAREIGVAHESLPVSMNDIADHLEDCIGQIELHLFNPSAVGKFLLSRYVRDRGFKVALTGEGSDELFAGYPYFKLEAIWRRLESPDPEIRRSGRRLLARFRKMERRSEGLLWNRTGSWRRMPRPFGFASYILTRVQEFEKYLPVLINCEKYGIEPGDSPSQRLVAEFEGWGLEDLHPLQASLVLSRSQLAAYIIPTLGDRVEMAHSIEGRTPFLDTNLAELTFRVPVDLQLDLDQLREKRLLHEALGQLLPPTARGTRKHPFFSPNWTALWQTRRGRELFEDYLSDVALDRVGLFRRPFVRRILCLWRWLPQNSSLRRRIDVLVGIVLTTQILHERLIRGQAVRSAAQFRAPRRVVEA